MKLHITRNGKVRCLYNETIKLKNLGSLNIKRASEVEPDSNGEWFADIRNGPTLGPFATRSEALQAERDWLEQRLGELE